MNANNVKALLANFSCIVDVQGAQNDGYSADADEITSSNRGKDYEIPLPIPADKPFAGMGAEDVEKFGNTRLWRVLRMVAIAAIVLVSKSRSDQCDTLSSPGNLIKYRTPHPLP